MFQKIGPYICFVKPMPGTEMYDGLKINKEFYPGLMFEHQSYGVWGTQYEEKAISDMVMEFNQKMACRRKRRPMFPKKN